MLQPSQVSVQVPLPGPMLSQVRSGAAADEVPQHWSRANRLNWCLCNSCVYLQSKWGLPDSAGPTDLELNLRQGWPQGPWAQPSPATPMLIEGKRKGVLQHDQRSGSADEDWLGTTENAEEESARSRNQSLVLASCAFFLCILGGCSVPRVDRLH